MYKLRKATKDDMPALLRMGQAFYLTTAFHTDMAIPYHEESMKQHIAAVLKGGIVVLAEVEETAEVVGMLGILLTPFPLNRNYTTASEAAWWIDPAHRGSKLAIGLLDLGTYLSKENGATHEILSDLSTSPGHVAALYESRGRRRVETAYMGAL